MKPIQEFKIDRFIKESFSQSFQIVDAGLYAIEIVASAKSWWQNLLARRSFFKDDDLTVKIDDREFPKLSGQRGLFDGEVAWNGNKLAGLQKTNLFVIKLNFGEHSLHFLADQKPYLVGIKIYQIQKAEIAYLPLDNPPAEGNRRPWLTIILADLALESLSIKARAAERKNDDDDLKLIIDGQIQKNTELKSHQYWHWCGRTLKNNSKTFSQKLNLQPKLHYIELWADGMPQLEEIILKLSKQKIDFEITDIKNYTYKGVNNDEDYNRFNQDILNAVNEWDRDFSTQKYPPPIPLDPNLVKAMIYIESRMGYEESGYPDVMQVADTRNPAIHTLNNDGWVDSQTGKVTREYEWNDGQVVVLDYHGEANGKTAQESIKWGVRWLYHKAQVITNDGKRHWRPWHEAVQDYNQRGNVEYERNVHDVYRDGLDKRNKKNPIRLWAIIVFVAVSLLGSVFGVKAYQAQGQVWLSFEDSQEEKVAYVLTAHLVQGLRVRKTTVSKFYTDNRDFLAITKESNPQSYPRDLFGNDEYEFIITGESRGGNLIRYILRKTNDGLKIVPNRGEYGNLDLAFSSHDIEFIDLDGDGTVEVRESYFIPYSNAPDQIWSSWYRYDETQGMYQFIRKNKIAVYKGHPCYARHKGAPCKEEGI